MAQNAKVDLEAAVSGKKSANLSYWSPESGDKLAWLSIEFTSPVTVMEILTQGSLGENKWTDTFVLGYSTEAPKEHRQFSFVREDVTDEVKVCGYENF